MHQSQVQQQHPPAHQLLVQEVPHLLLGPPPLRGLRLRMAQQLATAPQCCQVPWCCQLVQQQTTQQDSLQQHLVAMALLSYLLLSLYPLAQSLEPATQVQMGHQRAQGPSQQAMQQGQPLLGRQLTTAQNCLELLSPPPHPAHHLTTPQP